MKPIFIRTLVIASMFLSITSLSAQTFQANYEYDANGNRTKATVIYLSIPSSNNASSNSTPHFEEKIKIDPETNLTVKIFPNPTHGNLLVELSGGTQEQSNTPSNAIRVWDMQGKLLINMSPISSSNPVDFSNLGKGTYILQLFFGGQAKDYRIVKI